MTWLRDQILAPIFRLVRSIYCGLLDLTDRQQRALMTWGMLGGIIALEVFAWWALGRVDAHYPKDGKGDVAVEIIATYRESIRWLLALIGVFAGGMVVIARGGETTIKGPGGLEISARGAAAKDLAKREATIAAPDQGGTL